MRLLAVVEYNGINYKGWERQNDVSSIQETIENALSKISGEKITIFASGRTDAGVHAIGQTFHFDASALRYEINEFIYRLNCVLPSDIKILKMHEVPSDFHARFSATGKVYEYHIINDDKNPFFNDFAYIYPEKIDFDLFKESLQLFVGKHNYQDFTSKEEDQDEFIRIIHSIDILDEQEYGQIVIRLFGNGFMRYQIRFIVGAALAIASHKENINFIKKHLDSKKRDIINYKVPGYGLYLKEVKY